MDISALRKSRNTDFSKISGEFEKIANPSSETKSYNDDRFWKLEQDKAGNARGTIRFLPRTEGDELPWVRIFSHGFKGPTGKWYIENSLTTLDQSDPVGELNTKLWNSGTEANKTIARDQKRRLSYIANIYIVSDPKHPENNGQVRLFKFGKKIFDMIMDKARPTFEDEKPVNVFDFWEGANFKLTMRKVEGYTNYDQSTFSDPTPIADSEEDILAIANKQYKLAEFLAQKNFKSYDELKKKLASVLDSGESMTTAEAMSDEHPTMEMARPASKPAAAPAVAKAAKAIDDEEDPMAYFTDLLED